MFKAIVFWLRVSAIVLPVSVLTIMYLELVKISKYDDDFLVYVGIYCIGWLLFVAFCIYYKNKIIKALYEAVNRPDYGKDYLLIKDNLVEDLPLGSRRLLSIIVQGFFLLLIICVISLCFSPFAISSNVVEKVISFALIYLIFFGVFGYLLWKGLKMILWIRKGYK